MLNLTGDSCPYLQYSYARALSIVEKARAQGITPAIANFGDKLTILEKILYRFPEVVERSAKEYQPHHIATYLLTVAAAFSNFYGSNQIVNKDDPQSAYRVCTYAGFATVIKNGLNLLGIVAPEKM